MINHTLRNLSNIIWLCGILSATIFWGQKVDGKEDEGYSFQSSNLNVLGRYSRSPQMCTLRTISNLRFFILENPTLNCFFIGSGEHNIMP